MKFYLILIALALTVGCATGSRLNRVSLGMDKDEVIHRLGNPESTKAGDGDEVLVYDLHNCKLCGLTSEYWVVLRGGKVVQYGKAGDFGTSIPTQRVILQDGR